MQLLYTLVLCTWQCGTQAGPSYENERISKPQGTVLDLWARRICPQIFNQLQSTFIISILIATGTGTLKKLAPGILTLILWKITENPNEQIRLTTQVNCVGMPHNNLGYKSERRPQLGFWIRRRVRVFLHEVECIWTLKETIGTLFKAKK